MSLANPFGSSALFGIAWEVLITTDPSLLNSSDPADIVQIFDNGSYSQEQVQIEFECEYNCVSDTGFWIAQVAIYNLTDSQMQQIIETGQGIRLSAGWSRGATPYGTIFEGTLYQPMWERIDGINYKLTLRCIIGLLEQTLNFTSGNLAAGATQRALVSSMCQNAVVPMQTNFSNIDESLVVPSSRGEVWFGQPSEYLQQAARELGAQTWFTNLAVNIANLRTSQDNVPTYNYNANTGLIGTPQQTSDGVVVRVLLDPRVIPGSLVQLDPSTAINQVPRTVGSYPNMIDQNGKYSVFKVKHTGSSRGNIWQTELTCVVNIGNALAIIAGGG